jgi:hypothetical protein
VTSLELCHSNVVVAMCLGRLFISHLPRQLGERRVGLGETLVLADQRPLDGRLGHSVKGQDVLGEGIGDVTAAEIGRRHIVDLAGRCVLIERGPVACEPLSDDFFGAEPGDVRGVVA